MATAVGHGHGSPVGAVAAASGSSAAAALPAIGVSGLPAGAGGTISPLGRERSSLTSIGGPPRKEASYASSTASKISIATLPLDTLEHIFDDFRAHQHHGAKNHANGGNRGGRGGGGPAVRISTTVAAGGGGGGGGGRSSVRTWNPVPGGGSGAATAGPTRRSHGNVGSLSFHFAAKPTTPPGNGPGGVLPGVLMQPPVLPGLPPGAPISLSSRAAAVLQVPESAAHLQRFIALDSAQLENHFIIANPNGATVTDLQEVIDNASSIDGLPSGREAVVLLTTTADGVPVPRIVPLDQPVPGGLRRAGMGHARGASATGLGTVDALLLDGAVRLSNSSASLLMGGQGSMVDVSAGYEGGGGGGGTEGEAVTPTNAGNGSFARAGSNPILVPVPPLSPQRSMAALYSPRRGGTPPARRSDNGMPRGAPYTSTVRMSSVTMLGPGRPSSPPLRSTAGIAMQGNGPQFNTLPALGEGGGAASARRSAPRRRGSASALIRREASSDAVAQSLPVLVRTTSPDRSNLAVSIVTADVGFGSVDGGVDLMAASPINSCSVHPGGGGAGAGASTRPRSGAVDGAQDLSPTRSRLHARIVTLQTERSSNQLMQSAQVQRQPSPLQPRGGGRNGASRSTIIMSGLSGMELVRAALKQVETGERTLVDPLVRISCNGASEGSRRASHSSVTTTCSGLGSGVGGGSEVSQSGAAPVPMLDTAALAEEAAREEEEEREATERRQARLVKSLTMLLTTGRRDGRASRPSSAASRLSRHSSIVLVQEADDADNEDVGSDVGSSLNGEDEDLQHRTGDGHSQQPSGDGSTSTSSQPPQPSRESSQQHLRVPKSATFKHDHRRYNRFRSRLHAGSRQPSEMSNLGGHARSLRSSRDSDGDSDTLEAAVAIAADGGLDPQALVEFAQQLDKANEEFRLVEAARERARRLEALLTQAQLAVTNPAAAKRRATGDGSTAGAGGAGRAASPDKQSLDMYLLAKRREGNKPHNVTQVISALEAPMDRPMEVDLDQLLNSIGDALAADEQDIKATTFDETFRIRTERYLAQLCRMNPAAYEEVSAAQAEADYRSSVERAKLRLRQLHGEVAGEPLTSAGKPRSQYDKAVVMLQAHRPFFLPPVIQREVPERAPVPPMLGGRGSSRPPWDVYASIFRERKRGDARDVYDNDAVLAAQFHLDWSRTVTKMLFMKLVAREDLGVRGKSGRQALEQELAEVRSALAEHFGMIRSAFTFYSIATPEEVYTAALSAAVAAAASTGGSIEAAAAEIAANFTAAAAKRGPPAPAATRTSTSGAATTGVGRTVSPVTSSRDAAAAVEKPPSLAESEQAMTLAAAVAAANTAGGATGEGHHILEMDEQRWLAFCTSAGITGRTTGVRVSDMRALFWTVNREEEKNMTSESLANNDYAFMRFEFSEALVRAAFGRYITGGKIRDASDATRRLMEDLKMSLPPIARVDPNNFRRNRLYTAEMEVAVVHNLELLTASFKLYKARDRAKYLGVEHWMSFLETNNLMAHHMGGMTPTEARLMFAWSQMVVVDELKLRRRAVSLQLWDFVEAVARLADRIALPTTEEMDKWMLYNLNIGRHTPLPLGHTRVWTYCNALAIGRGGAGLERRASGREVLSAPTRPLAIKFRALMEYLAGSLAVAWGGNNTHETAQSMLRTANMLCGGVELA